MLTRKHVLQLMLIELELNHRVCSCALYFQNGSRLVAETIIIIIITITARPRVQQLHYREYLQRGGGGRDAGGQRNRGQCIFILSALSVSFNLLADGQPLGADWTTASPLPHRNVRLTKQPTDRASPRGCCSRHNGNLPS